MPEPTSLFSDQVFAFAECLAQWASLDSANRPRSDEENAWFADIARAEDMDPSIGTGSASTRPPTNPMLGEYIAPALDDDPLLFSLAVAPDATTQTVGGPSDG